MINLRDSNDAADCPLHLDFRGKSYSNSLVINEKKNGNWGTELRYYPKSGDMDDLFKNGAEIEVDFENPGIQIKINGVDFMDGAAFRISGRAAGAHTYNS